MYSTFRLLDVYPLRIARPVFLHGQEADFNITTTTDPLGMKLEE